jgi:hypothetical protein
MRYLLTILTLLQTIDSFGQKVNYDVVRPFTILYAENTNNGLGRIVKSLETVDIDDVLTIQNGGTLSLIHYTGFPIEINKDTTLVIRALQNAIVPVDEKKKKRVYSRTLVEPSIEHLFISKAIEGRKHKLQITGACMDCSFNLEIIYPPRFVEQTLNYSGDLCIKWRPNTTESYKLSILNSPKDLIKTYSTTKNELTIKNEHLKGQSKLGNDLILIISDTVSRQSYGPLNFKEFSNDKLEYPYPCDIKKASYALMAGLYLELSPRDYFEEAEKYFILATNLSEKQFYKDMLDNFRKRREK